MTIEILSSFFLYCTLINFGMMLITVIVLNLFRGTIHKVHAKFWHIKEEEIDSAVYKFMAFYKILTIVFFFVPYLALLIIGR